jgi:hypothetical protein
MKINKLTALCAVAVSAVLLSAVGVRAADEWFVMGSQTIKATDPSAEIKSEGGRRKKDVKQVKLSVEGADVDITSVTFGWDNRGDDTMSGVGTIKAGGQTAAKDAPGRKGRLTWVKIQYKILGGKDSATVKVWGLD